MRPAVLLRALPAVLLAVLVLATFRDYGYSWDEPWQNRWYGQAVLRFLSSAGQDRSATTENNFYLYGGAFDVAAELLVRATPFTPRDARHLANALAGLAGVAGAWMMARRLGGRASAAWAIVFLAACAPWYGHTFINAKDIPFAAGHVWALYLTLRFVEELPDPRLTTALALAAAIGFATGVRVGGVLNVAYLLAAVGAWGVARGRQVRLVPLLRSHGARIGASLAIVLGGAWVLMVAFWPAALLRPVAIPLEALRATSAFGWSGPVLWNGRDVWSTDLPWSYLPVVFAVQLSEVLVVWFPASMVWGLLVCAERPTDGRLAAARPGIALLLLAIVFPVAWAIAMRSTLYDNGRHFLFVLPPLAALAAVAWVWVLRVARRRRGLDLLVSLAMLAALAVPAVKVASLHPYEYTYLNAFAGGMPEGSRRFETDYWVTSYREAAQALVAHARTVVGASGRPEAPARRFTVAVFGSPETLEGELPEGFSVVPFDEDDPADYLVVTTRGRSDRTWPDYPVVATVSRRGMRYAVVKASPALARLAPPRR